MKKKRWFSITAKDCDFKFYRGSGKGGQNRNKRDSACRCSHNASGAVATAEEHKEQKQNKRAAFKRMVESKEFQSWLKLKIDVGLGNVEIEEQDKKGEFVKRKLNMNEV